ncbi:MAG TPA: limonene-1,2-epoxide hydrolase family protein [Acidimicrobiales bacterium]
MSDSTAAATEIDVVRAFLGALEARDVDRLLDLSDPAIVYQNMPLPPARGMVAFERQMRWFERYASGFEARIHNIAADGPTVLTERTDIIEFGRLRAEFWVCGTFEVQAGRVVLWRDYFDYVDVTVAFAKGALRAIVAALRGDAT